MTTDFALAPTPAAEQHDRSSRLRATAIAALRWPLNLWLESALWITLALSLGIAYATSYANLIHVAGAIGYGAWERNAVALAVDAPLTAAVLGQLLAARWRSPWWTKASLGLLALATAPATVAGNALNAAIVGDAFDWRRVDPLHLVGFSVPGAVVVLVALVATMMLGQRAALTQQATAGGRRSPSRTPSKRKRSRGARRPRSTSAGQSPDGAAARTALRELLNKQPDISAAAAAPLIERSPSYTRALLAELRNEGA